MKKYLKKKFIIGFLFYTTVVIFATVVVWETRYADAFKNWFNSEPITIQREEKQPTTIEEMINQKAEDYLKGPEAFEWAKQKVTEETVKELSKL